jgi:hypothetical protein
MTNIVAVQYADKNTGAFTGRAYSYFTDISLEVGDVVKCPTKYGETVGRVAETDVPEGRIDERVVPFMKTITEKAEQKEDAEDEYGI